MLNIKYTPEIVSFVVTDEGRSGFSFNMRDSIPTFRLPLLPEDEEPVIDLTPLLAGVYDRAGYNLVIRYDQPPKPLLSEQDTAWSAEILSASAT